MRKNAVVALPSPLTPCLCLCLQLLILFVHATCRSMLSAPLQRLLMSAAGSDDTAGSPWRGDDMQDVVAPIVRAAGAMLKGIATTVRSSSMAVAAGRHSLNALKPFATDVRIVSRAGASSVPVGGQLGEVTGRTCIRVLCRTEMWSVSPRHCAACQWSQHSVTHPRASAPVTYLSQAW